MKKQQAKAQKAILCLVALVLSQGCSTLQRRASGKSWIQTATEEDQAQRDSASQQGGWGIMP